MSSDPHKHGKEDEKRFSLLFDQLDHKMTILGPASVFPGKKERDRNCEICNPTNIQPEENDVRLR